MKKFSKKNINTPDYWDTHQTATDFGLRQQTYLELAGQGKRILELGCGLSPFLYKATTFRERWGVDFSRETIKKARELYPSVKYRTSDILHYRNNRLFDVIVAGEVIEHLEDPERLIEQMISLCKPGGRIIISTPILEFDDPEHLWEFDEQWFLERGFFTMTKNSDRFPGRSYIFAWKVVSLKKYV